MATAVIKNLGLPGPAYYAGPFVGWTTVKANAIVYASPTAAQAVIDKFHMYAIPDTAGTVTVVQFDASDTFVVPAGVTSLTRVQCWGGGGGGGGSNGTGAAEQSGGGGGGGAYAEVANFVVVPLDNLTITVGVGGTAGVGGDGTDTDGGNASATSIGDASIVEALGGNGGLSGTNGGIKGPGGSSISSTGTIKFRGGDGANGGAGAISNGGGGGSAAWSTQDGVTACLSVGGVGSDGGGTGGTGTTALPTNSTVPGAGAGGGGVQLSDFSNGRAGRDGRVIITYTAP